MENKKPAAEKIPWTRDEIMQLREKVREHYYMFDKAAQILGFYWVRNHPQVAVAGVMSVRASNGTFMPAELALDKDSWDLMSQADKDFVVFHEIMHLFLNHANRVPPRPPQSHRWLSRQSWQQITNCAQDIAINEMLMEMLFLDEKDAFKTITALNAETGERVPVPACTVRNVFSQLEVPESEWPSKTESSDFYTKEILKYIKKPENQEKQRSSQGMTPEEFEEAFPDFHPDDAELSDEQKEALNQTLNKDDFPDKTKERIKAELKDCEKEEEKPGKDKKKGGKKAGTERDGHWLLSKLTKPNPKPKWESVIKRWSERSEKVQVEETWISKRNRYDGLLGRLALPVYEVDPHADSKNRAIVAFYADTSGSCLGFIERFIKAARSLDPKKFEAKLYSFDTEVYDWNGSEKIRGGGGTDFDVVVKHAESLGRLDGIFVITDGYGTNVSPKEPKAWNVFLTDENASRQCFPPTVKQYELKDFE